MSRISLQIILVSTLLTAFGVSYWFFESGTDTQVSTPSKSDTKKEALILKSDLDWSKLPHEQLLEYSSRFQNTKPNEKHYGSAEVSPGESVVTSGYQIEPGVFAFAKLTPQLKEEVNGNDVIEVRNSIFVVSISGEYESVIDAPMNFTSGQSLAWGGGSRLGAHMVNVRATLNSESRKVRLETTELFYPDEKKAD